MKQTAIEWLVEQMLYPEFANPYIEQAKEMEKEQIIEAWMATDNPLQRMSAEQYYKETYEK